MDAISPVYLLLGAVICSMVGRFMLIRAAWEISKPWGIAVLCVPLAPMFFRMKYKELSSEGKNWLRGATAFGIGFMALTGSGGSIDELWSIVPERLRPAEYSGHRSADSDLVAEEGDDREEAEEAESEAVAETDVAAPPVTKLSHKATPEEKKQFFGRIATLLKGSSESAKPVTGAAPAATASTAAPAVPAASAAPAAPSLPLSVRVAANQAEFARLSDVYEKLKKERGYLKKWDQDQIKAYNEQAAKYQTDLAKTRADQMELNKQAAVVKK